MLIIVQIDITNFHIYCYSMLWSNGALQDCFKSTIESPRSSAAVAHTFRY